MLIASLGISDFDADAMLKEAFGPREGDATHMDSLLGDQLVDFTPGSILEGKVIGFAGDFVVVEVGLKSEGMVPKEEFDNLADLHIGDKIKVLLEKLDGEGGLIELSKRKADRMLNWQRIIDTTREGDVVEGRVMRKIKGGLLVDIGVPVFLPASQVDVRRPGEIGDFIGRDIRAAVLKIDQERRNIVISRRKLIEEERDSAKRR
ncbi:MAG: S1 RNA-binding domain-containing protein, partial [Pyrinomonadaceae bacterium]|nr:S1 RNA-binding domain-containing protein [Phycisphaerales bacterium]